MKTFHGSYAADDVTFLLKPIRVSDRNLQDLSTTALPLDYATLIASETPFGNDYIEMFKDAVKLNKIQVAEHVAMVAHQIARQKKGEIVITSLVRAGTPAGILLHRALLHMGRKSVHYSISATRKRGSDPSSLDYIISRHAPESITFVDGWTGKGYIASELEQAISDYNHTRAVNIDPRLAVLADLAGVAGFSASCQDFLIPAAMLRSTVCGLISASMIDPASGDKGSPDCCLFYDYLSPHDLSRYFVDSISPEVERLLADREFRQSAWTDSARLEAQRISDSFVDEMMSRYALSERNLVKPGICEANRALLTRNNRMKLIVRGDQGSAFEMSNLVYLAHKKQVEIDVAPVMPYRACVVLAS